MCVGHAAFTSTTGPVLRVQAIVLWNGAFPNLSSITISSRAFFVYCSSVSSPSASGIECFVNGVQGVKPFANHHAAHPRVACGGQRKPCPVQSPSRRLHLPAVLSVHLERGYRRSCDAGACVSVALRRNKPVCRTRATPTMPTPARMAKTTPKTQPSRMFQYFVYAMYRSVVAAMPRKLFSQPAIVQ